MEVELFEGVCAVCSGDGGRRRESGGSELNGVASVAELPTQC